MLVKYDVFPFLLSIFAHHTNAALLNQRFPVHTLLSEMNAENVWNEM